MRIFALLGIFCALVTALFFVWQLRFERDPEFFAVRLVDLKGMSSPTAGVEWLGPASAPTVRLSVNNAGSPVLVRIKLPMTKPIDFLHVRVRMKSLGLSVGQEPWSDGRCIIEWHPAGGGVSENDAVASVRGDDPGEVMNFVMHPKKSPAVPVLRLEHLGQAGVLELTEFEATAVRETWVWKIGHWALLAAWLAWAYVLVRHTGAKCRLRSMLAALVWLLMGIYFVVPGPWENLRPLAAPFQMGPEIAKASSTNIAEKPWVTDQAADVTEVKSVGKIPAQGDLLLRIKFQFLRLRPLLHLLLLFGPTLLIALLVGTRPALRLTAIFSFATEVAEVAYGYGFDSADVGDLIWDGVGIALGLWLSQFVMTAIFARRSEGGLTAE